MPIELHEQNLWSRWLYQQVGRFRVWSDFRNKTDLGRGIEILTPHNSKEPVMNWQGGLTVGKLTYDETWTPSSLV